jgi:hypothetical protein
VNGVEMFVVRLSEFSALAWATLKADLLFVIWELMGGKMAALLAQLLHGTFGPCVCTICQSASLSLHPYPVSHTQLLSYCLPACLPAG